MLYLLNLGKLSYGLIIYTAKRIHQLVFLARRFYSANNFVSFFPFFNEFRYHFDRVLEVTANAYSTISRRLTKSVIRRIELSEVLAVEYSLYLLIARADLSELLSG